MLKTILIFCLLAFSTAQAATFTVGTGGDAESSLGELNANWAGDTILFISDFTDTLSTTLSTPYGDGAVIDLNGYDVDWSVDVSGPGWNFADLSNLTIDGGGGTLTISGIWFRGSGDHVLRDINIVCSGTPSGNGWHYTPTNSTTSSLTLTDVYIDASAYESPSFIFNIRDNKLTFNWNGGSLVGGYHGIYWQSECPDNPCYIRDVAFSNATAGYLWRSVEGGQLNFDGCTFTKTAGFEYAGIYYNTPADSTAGAVIDSCTFTDTQLYIGDSRDGAQATGATISNCTFTGAEIGKQLIVRTNGAIIDGCTFSGAGGGNGGGDALSAHFLVLGEDGPADIYDDTSANDIVVKNCTFAPTVAYESTLSYYMIISKCKDPSIYNNVFDTRGITLPTGVTGYLVASRSTDGLSIYNNEITTDDEDWHLIKLSSQTAADSTVNTSIYNNIASGTSGPILTEYWWSGMTSYQFGSLDINNNYWGAGVVGELIDEDGEDDEVFSCADSSWYGSANFTDATSWRMELGGKAGLTGVTATPSGFVSVGATQRSTDPVISVNQAGFETPVEAFLRCRDLGLTGVELDWYIHGSGKADALNMDNWLNGTGATGDGTTSGSTWEAQAFDTLRVVRVR